jgi:hypothetical protein
MNVFGLTIGDWSHDGHGHTKTFFFQSNKTFKEALEAYRNAQKKLPTEIHPTNFMNDYQDHSLSTEVYEKGLKAGFDFLEGFKKKGEWRDQRTSNRFASGALLEYPDFGPEDMAQYVGWFVKQGDPDIELNLVRIDDLTGFEGLRDQIGYGLFR